MLPFKSGAKFVADKYKLRVQPVVLINTTSCYDIKKFHYSPKNITVIYMDSFIADKSDESWLKDVRLSVVSPPVNSFVSPIINPLRGLEAVAPET